jgi:hypothetical protein
MCWHDDDTTFVGDSDFPFIVVMLMTLVLMVVLLTLEMKKMITGKHDLST